MKKKIYIVSWNGISEAGGVERVTQYCLDAWSDEYDVKIIDYNILGQNKFAKKILKKHYVLDAIIASMYVYGVKRREPESKMVIQGFNCPFVTADIAIAHGTMRGYKIAIFNDKKWHFNQLFEKFGMKKARRVIAVSKSAKEQISKLYGVNYDKIDVIENCVDTDKFFPIEKKHDDVCTVLFAGRLEHGKGLKCILELADAIEAKSKYRLVIATNNYINSELFKEYKKTSIFVGLNAKEMNDFYNSGNVFFFPSLYEGFELVTLEALAAGVPVMGNDLGAIGDLYALGFDGVKILGNSMDENFKIIDELFDRFSDIKERENLHNSIDESFSIRIYNNKIKELWSK